MGYWAWKSQLCWRKRLMDQPTFADLEFENKKRKTRREVFL